ncbi:MAG: 50S ribosomal protein L22 [candidate division Zixibacteria bacterium]|nr:50S ribosomal protein L22 [candidate division Zixibacteria bacterium]
MTDQDTRPVKNRLLKAVAEMNQSGEKRTIRTWDRTANIKKDFVGHTFAVFNGRKFVRFTVNESMVGKKIGDIVPKNAPTARLQYSGIPARKMRLVAALIKGQPVEKALNILNFTSRYAAQPLAKAIKSAVANKLSVEGTSHLHPEDLYVKEIAVDGGPALKRIRMQSMGRVFRYKKPFSHVTILLGEHPTAPARPAPGRSGATGAAQMTPTTETAVKRIAKAKKTVARKNARTTAKKKARTTRSASKTKSPSKSKSKAK